MNDRDLILKAAALARSAPEAWKQFLGALANHTEQSRSNLVSSPIDQLPVLQGEARACTRLFQTLDNCLQTADKIEGKSK